MIKIAKNEAILKIEVIDGTAEITTNGAAYFTDNAEDVKKIQRFIASAKRNVCPDGTEGKTYRDEAKMWDLVKWMINKDA